MELLIKIYHKIKRALIDLWRWIIGQNEENEEDDESCCIDIEEVTNNCQVISQKIEEGEYEMYKRMNKSYKKYNNQNEAVVMVNTDVQLNHEPQYYKIDDQSPYDLYFTEKTGGLVGKVALGGFELSVTVSHVLAMMPEEEKKQFKMFNPHIWVNREVSKDVKNHGVVKIEEDCCVMTYQPSTCSNICVMTKVYDTQNFPLEKKNDKLTTLMITIIVPKIECVWSGSICVVKAKLFIVTSATLINEDKGHLLLIAVALKKTTMKILIGTYNCDGIG